MKRRLLQFALILMFALWPVVTVAKGKLEGPLRFSSKILGYDLQYWVYVPKKYKKPLPELYITDGQSYLGAGDMADILDEEIESGRIMPIAAIFIDSRDPDLQTETRRNQEFMCKTDYAKFFVGELMPRVSRRWTGADASTHRGIMGVSFGAINSACFGVMMPGVFQVLIMHSPGSSRHLDVINDLYRDKPKSPSAVFISNGSQNDNEDAVRRFVGTLEDKGYPVRHVSTDGGHDWEQWRPLIDDSLRAFAGSRAEDEIE